MPGPYDLYGEQRSASSRLPFGLGSDGLSAMWPDAVFGLAGGALKRSAVASHTGRGFFGGTGITRTGYSAAEQGLVSRLDKIKAGAPRDYARAAESIFYRNPNPVYQVNRISHTVGPATTSLSIGGRTVTAQEAMQAQWAARSGAVNAARGQANRWRLGASATGIATSFAIMQLTAGMIDIGHSLGQSYIDWKPRRPSGSPNDFSRTSYYDPQGAYTQRQRAIQAIHNSQLSTRAAIGNEASFMHG